MDGLRQDTTDVSTDAAPTVAYNPKTRNVMSFVNLSWNKSS